MRRLMLTMFAALAVAACSNDTTGPDSAALTADFEAFESALTLNGGYDAVLYHDRLINALPDDLKLTDDQKARIRSLVDAFQAATKADREALGAILQEARQAIRDRKSREEIRAILDTAVPIRARLIEAEKKLVADIAAVLTPEQRAWINAHKPQRCRPDKFPPLTEAQRTEIRELEQNFREEHKADIEALGDILEEAREALRAGKSREEIAAIIARGATIAARLASARRELHQDIRDVLTPEQLASGCFPLG